jgi:hypothetical protein
MTLEKFKKLAKLKAKGGSKLPTTNDDYSLLINESIKNISMGIVCIDLIDTDPTKEILRWINSIQFIRYPTDLVNDSDTLDIDEQLRSAVLYDFLVDFATQEDEIIFFKKRDEIINNYKWANYKVLESIGLANNQLLGDI